MSSMITTIVLLLLVSATPAWADAQEDFKHALGLLLEHVAQNNTEAAALFRRAADQGFAPAQVYLGVMYAKGEGVSQDFKQAMFWYRKAAEQGMADAQLYLGLMYDNGEGVVRDYVEADKWFNIAAAKGNAVAAKDCDLIMKKMTPEQIAEAQRRASEWMAGFERKRKK